MQKITETQLRILERLNEYRFLTVGQLLRLGVAKARKTIDRAIKGLHTKKPLVKYSEFGTFPTLGRLPRINYLTKHGAETLAEYLQVEQEKISYPKGVKIFSRDYFHRIETIDLHILARTFCNIHEDEGLEFDFFQAYFEHTGANHWGNPKNPKREALNKIIIDEKTAIIPDCIFQITDPNGKPWLFMGEIYRGHTTKRVHQQLGRYLTALEKGSINKAYNFPRAIPVLIVCESENSMLALMKRLKNDVSFQLAEDYFLFRTIKPVKQGDTKQIIEGFAKGWRTYRGKEKVLFVS